MRIGAMRTGITIDVTASGRDRLLAVIGDATPAETRLARPDRAADRRWPRHGRNHAPGGVAKTAVWRWQERFMQAGVDGLLRDKTRPPRIPPLAREVVEKVVD